MFKYVIVFLLLLNPFYYFYMCGVHCHSCNIAANTLVLGYVNRPFVSELQFSGVFKDMVII